MTIRPNKARSRYRYVVAAILLILICLGYGAFQRLETAIRAQRQRTLKLILQALSNHHDTYRRLPASVHRDFSGRPLCSWRFHIMVFLEQDVLGRFPQEYWLDPVNFESVALPSCCFRSPRYDKPVDPHTTNFSFVTGPGTPFDGGWWSLDDLDPDTILVVEVVDFGYHWMEPGDLKLDELSSLLTVGLDGKGLHVGFADEQVWFLDSSVPLEDLKPFFTVDGARQYDREEKLGPYRRERVRSTPSDAGRLVLLWLGTLLPASRERTSHFPANAWFKGSREQTELEQRINKLGGTVHGFWKEDFAEITLGESWHGGNENLDLLWRYPAVSRLDIGYPDFDDAALQKVVKLPFLKALELTGTRVTAHGLGTLSQAPHLDLLRLRGGHVTDDSLAALQGLDLKWLIVEPDSRISDLGLAHLGNHTGLLCLKLPGAEISGAGFRALNGWSELRDLDLSGTAFDDDALRHLAAFEKINRLNLSGSQVTGTDFVQLAGCTRLRELNLERTPVSDTHLGQVVSLPALEILSLSDTRVTDAGLRLLAESTSLITLSLVNTDTTASGFRSLARAPCLRTVYDRDGNTIVFEALRDRGPTWIMTTSGLIHLLDEEGGKRVFLWTDDDLQEVKPLE
jgi:hypothetical protein